MDCHSLLADVVVKPDAFSNGEILLRLCLLRIEHLFMANIADSSNISSEVSPLSWFSKTKTELPELPCSFL